MQNKVVANLVQFISNNNNIENFLTNFKDLINKVLKVYNNAEYRINNGSYFDKNSFEIHLNLENIGNIDGTGYLTYDWTAIIELTDNINESNTIDGLVAGTALNVNGNIYYGVKRCNIHNLPIIYQINSNYDTSYSSARGGTQSNPNVFILNQPPLKSNDSLRIKLELTEDQFLPNKIYAALADDGTYFNFPEGDTPGETIETLSPFTNNIFIWTMHDYTPSSNTPINSGNYPNYNNFTIINESNGEYIFDNEDYSVFEKWDNVITSLPSKHNTNNTKLIFRINIGTMESNTLGYTQINDYYFNNNFSIPYVIKDASIVFNKSLIQTLKLQIRNGGKSTFYYMFLHEIGHGLGIGALFDNNNLKETSNGTQWYIGSNAVREYNYYFTDNSYDRIPIENNGGGGTANVHLEEGDEGTVSSNNRYYNGVLHPGLDHELMSGWADNINYQLPMSRITLGCLEDLGYSVDYNEVETYDPSDFTVY